MYVTDVSNLLLGGATTDETKLAMSTVIKNSFHLIFQILV